MSQWYVWVGLLTKGMGKHLITELVTTKRYSVGPLSDDGESFSVKDFPLLAIQLGHNKVEDHSDVIKDVKAILTKLGATYTSVVVTSVCSCTWSAGATPQTPPKSAIDRLIDEPDA